MIVNINARICTNNSVYVQYQESGKAKDIALANWLAFVEWITIKVQNENPAS